MIQIADDTTKQEVRAMWKICFGDSDAYMDIYFNHKYRNENKGHVHGGAVGGNTVFSGIFHQLDVIQHTYQ